MLASFRFGLWVLLFSLLACSDQNDVEERAAAVRLQGATMGTTYNLTVVAPLDESASASLQKAVDARLTLINQQMSTYIPDSEINNLNQATVSEWLDISPELYQVLGISQKISELSNGAFDITIRPLIDIWGFGAGESSDEIPDSDVIKSGLSRIGYQAVELDAGKPRLRMLEARTLDLSAVAKGFAVDQIAELLNTRGFDDHLIEIGGELRLSGRNPKGELWRIAIERPQTELMQQVFKVLPVSDKAVATSGDYRNYFEKNGVRFSHTIDPATGKPIKHNLASVTVVADTAAEADALATAFNVMGAERALPLANGAGIAAFFIIREGDGFKELSSDAFEPYLVSMM